MTISRILVPTDFSEHADAAFQYALELARPYQANIHLVHVVDNPLAAGMWASEIYTAEIAGLQIGLVRDSEERLKQTVPANAGNVTTEALSGNPTSQILDAARRFGADLIVMGTHGRTGVAHVVMGSVAERVSRRAPCPVLTLRATQKGTSAPAVETKGITTLV